MNQLAAIEQQFEPLMPRLEKALAGAMPVARLVQSVMVSCETNPALLEANRQSLFSAAMGACMLGLSVDGGAVGQAYLVPFKGRVQLLPGYKGLITLAARAGFTVNANLVRESDNFAIKHGTNPTIEHDFDPRLSKVQRGKVIGGYAVFRSNTMPAVQKWMDIAEINEVNSGRNVWKTNPEAMQLKTVIRRAVALLPLETMKDLGMAVALEEEHNLGNHAEITPQGAVKVNSGVEVQETPQDVSTRLDGATKRGPYDLDVGEMVIQCQTPEKYAAAFMQELETTSDWRALFDANTDTLKQIRQDDPKTADLLQAEYKKCKGPQP